MQAQISLEAIYARAYGRAIEPYPFQRALAVEPDIEVVIAPTGLGKTAGVTLGWVYRLVNTPQQTPHKLVWCLPIRTLVEQIAGEVAGWISRLQGIFVQVGQPLPTVHILMGGATSEDWRLHPEQAAVVVGTQDMLLSRALMRGYGMSRFGWPIDFGLLHADALWVFDEVQLMGAGLATSAQIESFRRRGGWHCERASTSLWVSATLQPEWLATVDFRREIPSPRTLRWNEGNPPEPKGLSDRLDAVKRVSQAKTMLSDAQEKLPEAYAAALGAEVLAKHRSGQTTLVIVNTVARAQAIYRALVKAGRDQGGLLLLHSRFRPPDRAHLVEQLLREEEADRIIVATQAVEAGVDITSAVLFTELAPWSSLVQRFGRCNRRGELNDTGGAEICWIDLEQTEICARPYGIEPVDAARQVMTQLADAAPRRLPPALSPPEAKQVIRAGDFEQLFDTDSDLSGYDLDVSPYIRDTDETAVSLFWRQTNGEDRVAASRPERDELCSAPLGRNLDIWLKNQPNGKPAPVYVENPNGEDRRRRRKAGWLRLDRAQTRLRPGMVLMLDVAMGGYDPKLGFVGSRSSVPVDPVASAVGVNSADTDLGETYEDDGLTQDGYDIPVPLERHLRHVETLARKIAAGIGLGAEIGVLVRSARWHDVGKAYAPFQELLGRAADSPLLAKSATGARPAARPAGLRRYFRHELASALAFLDQHDGEPQADLVAFLIAAHHGKVRMGMRAMPEETAESPEKRIARGIQDGDELLEVRCGGEISAATKLDLSLMEMGEDEKGRPSWAARTQALLRELGPFRLAYLEALLRLADWRASAAERRGELDDE